jgi:hypothetical protein
MTAILTGIYLGLLTLLFLDYKKRIQSLLLLIGTLACFVVFSFTGILFRFLTVSDYIILGGSAIAIIYLLGRAKLRQLNIDANNIFNSRVLVTSTDEPLEFPKAAYYLKWVMILFVVVSYFEANLEYAPLLIIESGGLIFSGIPEFTWTGNGLIVAGEAVASLLLIISLSAFFEYDAGKSIVFIGPPRSGKTHLIIGLYSAAQSANYNPRQVSEYLTQQREELLRTRSWVPETQADISQMGFQFSSNNFPSKNIIIDGLDYPGEYSYFIPEGLEMASAGLELPDRPIDQLPQDIEFGGEIPLGSQVDKNEGWDHLIANADNGFENQYKNAIADIRARRSSSTAPAGRQPDRIYLHMVNSVLPRIRNADAVGFVFDTREHLRWMNEDENAQHTQIEYYQRIIDQSNASEKIGIATKSDLLIEDFKDERFADPHDAPDEFRQYVNDRLLNGPYRGAIQTLQVTLHPTYIETDSGDPVLPLQVFGMNELLEKLSD